jgi:hypothetical protein
MTLNISNKQAHQLIEEEHTNQILKIAKEKIKYLKNKNIGKGSLDLK